MISQLVLDDATIMQLLGDPRIWKIIPSIRGKHEAWQKASEEASQQGCSTCQKNAAEQKKAAILNDVRSLMVGLPNAHRLQLKQLLSAKTLLIFLPTGGKTVKHIL